MEYIEMDSEREAIEYAKENDLVYHGCKNNGYGFIAAFSEKEEMKEVKKEKGYILYTFHNGKKMYYGKTSPTFMKKDAQIFNEKEISKKLHFLNKNSYYEWEKMETKN